MATAGTGLARALLALIGGRRAVVSRRTQALQIISVTGLVIAVADLAFTLPTLLATGGAEPFLADLTGTVYTVALIALAAGLTRTVPWRAVLGLFFVGFFGVTALATLVGRPVLAGLAPGDAFGPVVYAPLSEELLKALPVAVVIWLAARNRSFRPSVGDAVLLGVALGAGFALYEDAVYGRGYGTGWLAAVPFSLLIPSVHPGGAFGTGFFVGGHVVYTGVASLGQAVGLLYGRRFRWAWIAIPMTFAVAVLEHMTANALTLMAYPPWWVQAGSTLTLGGHLSWLLLVGGLAVMTFAEARALRPLSVTERGWRRLPALLLIDPAEGFRRAGALALYQSSGMAMTTPPAATNVSQQASAE
jgi:RsiW-degrading membrane proteinase PrsW (M82 family)